MLFLVVIWLALVYWTYADARRRIADPLLVGCATAASLFPFVGTIVYMIVRPPEYLDDVRERELEMQAAEARLAELGYHLCPHCDYEVEKDFLRCPNCMRKLKDPCQSCGRPLDPTLEGMPVLRGRARRRQHPTPRRQRRRDAARATSESAAEQTVDDLNAATSVLRKETAVHGAHAHPRQARRLRAQPDRRDHRPLRAQGAAARGAAADDDDPRAGRAHYAEHDGKPFFEELVEFITSGPLVAMVLEGEQAVVAARQVIGATNPLEANTGSIRGDYAIEVGQNMVHGSDSPQSAAREVGLFFPDLA